MSLHSWPGGRRYHCEDIRQWFNEWPKNWRSRDIRRLWNIRGIYYGTHWKAGSNTRWFRYAVCSGMYDAGTYCSLSFFFCRWWHCQTWRLGIGVRSGEWDGTVDGTNVCIERLSSHWHHITIKAAGKYSLVLCLRTDCCIGKCTRKITCILCLCGWYCGSSHENNRWTGMQNDHRWYWQSDVWDLIEMPRQAWPVRFIRKCFWLCACISRVEIASAKCLCNSAKIKWLCRNSWGIIGKGKWGL